VLFALPTAAEAPDIAPESEVVADELRDFRDAIPPEVAELLPEGFFSEDMSAVADATSKAGAFSAVLSVVGRMTGLAVRENLTLLAAICAILCFSALLRAFADKGSTARALGFAATLTLVVLLLTLQGERFGAITQFFHTVGGLGASMLPLMGALYAMGGNVGAAVANSGVLSAFLSLLETLCATTVLPVAGIALALALVDALTTGVNLRPLAGLIKRTYTLSISFLMGIFGFVLGTQSLLAKASDTLALRTARFAAGSFLPLVGGSVSEALRTVAGSVEYLRASVGTGAILVLFFAFLPTFLSVLLTRITFLLGGAVANMLSCEAEGKLLAELSSVYGYFLAIISVLFVALIFSLTLFAQCAAVR
jgi:stage III sporulation protein AE